MRNKHSLDHVVQRAIFTSLVKNSQCSFSGLKPKDVDSNLFTYHLQKLIGKGYVEKSGRGVYALTDYGQFLASHFSTNQKDFVFGPTSLSLLAIYDAEGRGPFAFFRDREPYYKKYSLPSGKIHQGEGIKDAAIRELKEKAGISNPLDLQYRGTVAIYGEDENHITGLVWSTKVATFTDFNCRTGSIKRIDWGSITEDETIFATKELVKILNTSPQRFCVEVDERTKKLKSY